MYKINDHIVYNRSVCIIKDIKEIRGQKYYVLSPSLDDSLTNYLPVDNKEVRKVIDKKRMNEIIELIPTIKPLEDNNNKIIEQEYKRLLSSGNLEDLIKIIKTTYLRNDNRSKNGKKIGEKDNTYFELAEKILYSEFAIVLNKSFDETKKYLAERLENINNN